MIDGIPRLSVCIICYKQEELIKRCLNSILSQKDYIYEICVSDDCSTDNTWAVLENYAKNYPGLFKLHRNSSNKGIFENVEQIWTMPTGDMVTIMAGDDECGEYYFKNVINYVLRQGIDYKNELFCIYGDYKLINKDGTSIIYKNDLVVKYDPIRLRLRKLLSNRTACYSIKILRLFEKTSEGRSYIVEHAQDIQLELYTRQNYYIPIVGNIYHAQIGVSSHLNDTDKIDSMIRAYDKLVEFLLNHDVKITNKDISYIEYMKAYRSRQYFKAVVNYLRSIDFSLGLAGLQLNRIFFVIKKRIKRR